MPESFSISKDSIQIPYSRFLSESAAGFILILLSITAYYFPLISSEPLRKSDIIASGFVPGSQVKVFILIVAFLLATPLGYVVNAFSWSLLTQPIAFIEKRCYRYGVTPDSSFFPAFYTSAARHVPDLAAELGINEDNFSEHTWFLRSVLEHQNVARLGPETSVRGLVILLRNCSLFALTAAFLCLYNARPLANLRWLPIVSAVGLVVALLCRWRRRNGVADCWRAAGATFGFIGFLWACIDAWDDQLAPRAAMLFVIAAVLIVLAGVVGYYNCSWAILHTHLAAAAVGASTIASSPKLRDTPLGVATAIVRQAARRNLGQL